MNEVSLHIALSPEGNKLKVETNAPVLFLAGPIRNAPKWHYDAIRQVMEVNQKVCIAAPIRQLPIDLHPYAFTDQDADETFKRQREWELYYLERAAARGCTMFWLSNESEAKEFQEKVFAHITMMELGSAIGRRKQFGTAFNLVVGVDTKFPEWETIKMDLDRLPHLIVCYTLRDTVNQALKLIQISEDYGK